MSLERLQAGFRAAYDVVGILRWCVSTSHHRVVHSSRNNLEILRNGRSRQ